MKMFQKNPDENLSLNYVNTREIKVSTSVMYVVFFFCRNKGKISKLSNR